LGVYTNASPILAAYNLNATEYVITDNVGSSSFYMNISQVTTLYNAGWDIGDHTKNHINLISVPKSVAQANISEAQQQLASWGFTKSMLHIAYLGGSVFDELS
jgi:peptidoglycan/xylan/chitin deacetylase (PgdA/CDA1 family)